MRVISGKHRRILLDGYDIDGIRPTMDKVKEAIFGMISPYISGSSCLDLFSGSASLGIEALSNGASFVYFVDNYKKAIEVTKKNIDKLGLVDSCSIIFDDYKNALKKLTEKNKKFDIIFLDPPYSKIKISSLLKEINDMNLLLDDGIVVCEYEDELLDNEYDDLTLIKDRKYGKTYIKVYKKR